MDATTEGIVSSIYYYSLTVIDILVFGSNKCVDAFIDRLEMQGPWNLLEFYYRYQSLINDTFSSFLGGSPQHKTRANQYRIKAKMQAHRNKKHQAEKQVIKNMAMEKVAEVFNLKQSGS